MTIPVDFALPQMITFILVVARLSGLFLLAPVFSSPMIPVKIKIFGLLAMAVTMTPMVIHGSPNVPTEIIPMAVAILKESLIGFTLGFSVAIVFAAVQVGASMIDTSIGFSLASIIDPLNNSQSSIFGSFYSMVATLSFLAVNGHYWLFAGFVRSYDIIKVDQVPNFQRLFENTSQLFFQMFVIAFQIAAPILLTLLMCDVVLGVISRVVPQMNVFFVGIPLKIGIGMGAVVFAMPTFVSFFQARLADVVTGASVLAGAAG